VITPFPTLASMSPAEKMMSCLCVMPASSLTRFICCFKPMRTHNSLLLIKFVVFFCWGKIFKVKIPIKQHSLKFTSKKHEDLITMKNPTMLFVLLALCLVLVSVPTLATQEDWLFKDLSTNIYGATFVQGDLIVATNEFNTQWSLDFGQTWETPASSSNGFWRVVGYPDNVVNDIVLGVGNQSVAVIVENTNTGARELVRINDFLGWLDGTNPAGNWVNITPSGCLGGVVDVAMGAGFDLVVACGNKVFKDTSIHFVESNSWDVEQNIAGARAVAMSEVASRWAIVTNNNVTMLENLGTPFGAGGRTLDDTSGVYDATWADGNGNGFDGVFFTTSSGNATFYDNEVNTLSNILQIPFTPATDVECGLFSVDGANTYCVVGFVDGSMWLSTSSGVTWEQQSGYSGNAVQDFSVDGDNVAVVDNAGLYYNGVPPCVPDWYCDAYEDICVEGEAHDCVSVLDNNACGEAYTGDYSEFQTICHTDINLGASTLLFYDDFETGDLSAWDYLNNPPEVLFDAYYITYYLHNRLTHNSSVGVDVSVNSSQDVVINLENVDFIFSGDERFGFVFSEETSAIAMGSSCSDCLGLSYYNKMLYYQVGSTFTQVQSLPPDFVGEIDVTIELTLKKEGVMMIEIFDNQGNLQWSDVGGTFNAGDIPQTFWVYHYNPLLNTDLNINVGAIALYNTRLSPLETITEDTQTIPAFIQDLSVFGSLSGSTGECWLVFDEIGEAFTGFSGNVPRINYTTPQIYEFNLLGIIPELDGGLADGWNGDGLQHQYEIYCADATSGQFPVAVTDDNYALTFDLCSPDWYCSGYSACLVNDTQLCNAVTDYNACGEAYTGDYSEFAPESCDYCYPNFVCDTYEACGTDDLQDCSSVVDTNNCFAQTGLFADQYSGDGSEFDASCDFCVPSWSCSEFGACQEGDVEPCLAVEDANSCFSQTGLPADEFSGDLSTYDDACDYSAEETAGATNFLIGALLAVFLAMMFLSVFSEQIGKNPNFKEMLPKVQRVLIAITIALIALTLLSLAI